MNLLQDAKLDIFGGRSSHDVLIDYYHHVTNEGAKTGATGQSGPFTPKTMGKGKSPVKYDDFAGTVQMDISCGHAQQRKS